MRLPDRKILLLNCVLLAILLSHSISRDILMEKQYPGDLRNRVVGARLQKDGNTAPYTFRWKTSDGMRYYDPQSNPRFQTNADSIPNSITASPFFHELLFPICDLPQRTFSVLWLWLQYFFLAAMICMSVAVVADPRVKWLIINFGVLFTWTEAWKGQIGAGQIYVFNAFLMFCIFFCMFRNKKYGMLTGSILTAAFILCRPIAIVFFIPFLFNFKKYRTFLLTGSGALLLYIVFVLVSPREMAIYKNYFRSMKMHIALHQSDNPDADFESNTKFELYNHLEGFDLVAVYRLETEHPVKLYDENGNIFMFYKVLTHKKMSLGWLNGLMVATIGILCLLFLIRQRKYPVTLAQATLFGIALYMLVEIFSPVHRHQYNTTQWLAPVFICFMMSPGKKRLIFPLLFLGLFLNIVNFPWLYLRHSLGEFCWLAAMGIAVFSGQKKSALPEPR